MRVRGIWLCMITMNTAATLFSYDTFYGWLGWIINVLFVAMFSLTPMMQTSAHIRLGRAERKLEELNVAYDKRLGRLSSYEHNKGRKVSELISVRTFRDIARMYPEIKWYKTVEEMIAAHSLTTYNQTPGYYEEPKLRKNIEGTHW